ncbi:uncharacterized protein JCM6883_005201 [Sporobolomyces salmoneus]|uniref:uncharacterized protein n=1 Tax=Sporobolomyces salmoneus TaxID=183962 RepID=UPI00317C1C71
MAQLQSSNLFSVQGKVCLVTGGGSGLGEIMATGLVKNGAKVYIASRKEAALKAVAERLTKEGPGSCEYIVADLGSKEGVDKLCAEVKRRTDKLHVLVNNSGTTWGAQFTDFPEKSGWDRVIATNVKSVYYVTAGLVELLAKDSTNLDPGRVVNITSIAGISPVADGSKLAEPGHGLWSYNASKAAANHLTKSLAITLAPRNITCSAIAPGVYKTNMTARGFAKDEESILENQPMGRTGTPEDIAGLLLFLVSRAGAHITGNVIHSDGGALYGGSRMARI